jgi:hypothetical protein
MRKPVSRRDFLKLSTLALGSLALRPLSDWLPEDGSYYYEPVGVARVTIADIDIFKEPSTQSEIIDRFYRDQLIPIFEEIIDPQALPNHPRWYRTHNGYMNSMYTQRVEGRHLNEPVPWVPEEGKLGEITVPYTRAYLNNPIYGWMPVYRLYYRSAHWITGVEEGPDGKAWYQLSDESDDNLKYYVPGPHVRLIPPEELTPISPDVPPEHKRIEVSLVDQELKAYEYDLVVLRTLISSGIPGLESSNGIPTATPTGRFNIQNKMPSKHMGNGRITDDIAAYELPGVPWVSFFVFETGVAFHGTYWHYNFGRRMSHGCVNMTMEDAKWLYRWALPVSEVFEWEHRGLGTQVVVY